MRGPTRTIRIDSRKTLRSRNCFVLVLFSSLLLACVAALFYVNEASLNDDHHTSARARLLMLAQDDSKRTTAAAAAATEAIIDVPLPPPSVRGVPIPNAASDTMLSSLQLVDVNAPIPTFNKPIVNSATNDDFPKAKFHDMIATLMQDRPRKQPDPSPDFNDATFDKEAAMIRKRDVVLTRMDAVDQSLLLMTRRGHRHRMTDLIGGEHLSSNQTRTRLLTALRFDSHPPVQDRSYEVKPISIRHPGLGHNSPNCYIPMPCESTCTTSYCDTLEEQFSMENSYGSPVVRPGGTKLDVHNNNAAPRIFGNTLLTGEIPVPYFSWHDFGVMEPLSSSPKTTVAAAFISNCASSKRNNMVRDLIAHLGDDRVHSYGACVNNKREERSGSQNQRKVDRLKTFKFSLSFENSETVDYATEKQFQPFCAGSVPVVIGAPNIKFFAVDTTPYPYESNSLIHTADLDFDSGKVAKLLDMLDKDTAAYDEMLRWKKTGYSDDFKALIDYTSSWTPCRICVFAGDARRSALGPDPTEVNALRTFGQGSFALYVRERGTMFFTKFLFPGKPTLKRLTEITLQHFKPVEWVKFLNNDDKRGLPVRIYGFYTGQHRVPVLADEDIAVLLSGAELTVIFV